VIFQTIGVACVEANDCMFSVLEFCDDDFFAELEALIVLLGPKECLLPSIDGEVHSKLKHYLKNVFKLF